MEKKLGDRVLALAQGDITAFAADAIGNAANAALAGGGGVDGAIHRAAGPTLMADLRRYEGCPTGSAVITPAGNLRARHVIHAVGPRWRGGDRGEAEQLAGAYRRTLELADEAGCRTLALPSISTGVYGYPVAQAAPLALATVRDYLTREARVLERVTFVLFDTATFRAFAEAAERL
ncbi:MAG: macro domain-containing protein [Planctomycetes bacterium]|nr:macro domain-containing protein [Planctomycetota bacterium]